MALRTGPITKDASTVAVGLAQIRVGNSASTISNFSPALTDTHSIGALADTKLVSNIEYWKLESGFPAQEDLSIPLKESVSLECSFKEITPRTLALARGIDITGGGSAVTPVGMATLNSAAGTFGAGPIVCLATCPLDTFTVVFSSASAYTLIGFNTVVSGSGTVSGSSVFTVAGVATAITIPANYFTGTWASGDRFRFSTEKSDYTNNNVGSISLGGMNAPAYVRMEAFYAFPTPNKYMTIIFPRANVTSSLEIAFNASDNATPSITFESKGSGASSGGHAVWDSSTLGRIVFHTS